MSTAERKPGRDGRRQAKQNPRTDGADARERGRPRAGGKTSPKGGRRPPEPAPSTVEEALARALRHGRNALAEGLLAGRALLDAASLSVSGRPAGASDDPAAAGDAARALAGVAAAIDGLARRLHADSPDAGLDLVHALLEALDVEIGRWEDRARQDPDARAVLRAFLGLRELLWELGMRPAAEPSAPRDAHPSPPRRSRAPAEPSDHTKSAAPASEQKPSPKTTRRAGTRRRRVQRVEIER